MTNPLHWAAEHPVPVAIGVFAVGAVLLLVMGHGSGGGGGGDMAAFYAAQGAQAQAAAGLAATQNSNATALGIAGIQAGVTNHSTDAAVTINQSDNNLAAYQTYKQVRLQTQQSQFAYQAGVNGNNVAAFTDALSTINHGLSFGTAH